MRIAIQNGPSVDMLTGQESPAPAGAVVSPTNWKDMLGVLPEYRLIEEVGGVLVLREMTQEEKDVVDNARLDQLKAEKVAAIDARTEELILEGFEFGGERFSMSKNAQRNWTGLGTAHALGMIPFPYAVSTVDEGTFILTDATMLMQFLGAYLMYQADPTKPLGAGRLLKSAVEASDTVAELRTVVDNR